MVGGEHRALAWEATRPPPLMLRVTLGQPETLLGLGSKSVRCEGRYQPDRLMVKPTSQNGIENNRKDGILWSLDKNEEFEFLLVLIEMPKEY